MDGNSTGLVVVNVVVFVVFVVDGNRTGVVDVSGYRFGAVVVNEPEYGGVKEDD